MSTTASFSALRQCVTDFGDDVAGVDGHVVNVDGHGVSVFDGGKSFDSDYMCIERELRLGFPSYNDINTETMERTLKM